MPRRGRHRTTGPVRIVAAAAAVLVAGGVVVAAGSASAHTGSDSADGSGLVSRLTESLSTSGDDDRGSDERSSEDQRADRDSGDRDSRDRDDRDSDDGGHRDGSSGNDRRDDRHRGDQDRGRDHHGDRNEDRNQDRRDDGNEDGDEDGDEGQAEEQFKGRDQAARPDASDFVDIRQVDPGSEGDGGRFSAAGTFRVDCGTNADGSHRNSDNIVLGPGKRNAAQHVHDYVGTTATTFASSDEELRSASTTCTNGD